DVPGVGAAPADVLAVHRDGAALGADRFWSGMSCAHASRLLDPRPESLPQDRNARRHAAIHAGVPPSRLGYWMLERNAAGWPGSFMLRLVSTSLSPSTRSTTRSRST